MATFLTTALFGSILLQVVLSVDNGLGVRPPLGWRSWNAYHHDISQELMTECINALLDKSRDINGTPMSLYEVGYTEFGVDDTWQECQETGSDAGNIYNNRFISMYIYDKICT